MRDSAAGIPLQVVLDALGCVGDLLHLPAHLKDQVLVSLNSLVNQKVTTIKLDGLALLPPFAFFSLVACPSLPMFPAYRCRPLLSFSWSPIRMAL